jgi:hypothetical protein
MKHTLLLASLFFLGVPGRAQRPIDVSYQVDAQGRYQFFCNNKAFCSYILEVKFTAMENAKPDQPLPFRTAVKPGRTNLFRLTKENTEIPASFRYTISYNKGCIHPRVNPDFTYLLPIGPGKQAQAFEMENLDKPGTGDSQPRGWYVIRLRMKPGDTIYAARRGIVTEIDDQSNLNDSGVASAGSENYLEIVHLDCSFGHYGILRRNSALVKPGQPVEAGQPIGLVGGDRFGRGAEARFSVYYNLDMPDSLSHDEKVNWLYIPLQFWTKRNGKSKLKNGATYTCEDPPALVIQEQPRALAPRPKTKKKPG